MPAQRDVLHRSFGITQIASRLDAQDPDEFHAFAVVKKSDQFAFIFKTVRQNSLKQPAASLACPVGIHSANASA